MESMVAAVVVFGSVVFIPYLVIRLLRLFYTPRKEARLSELLGVPGGRKITFERHGRTFVAEAIRGGKHGPDKVMLITRPDTGPARRLLDEGPGGTRGSVEMQPRLVLRRETKTDRWGKEKGLNDEVQVGDADFDGRIYIESDSDPALVRRTFANPALRARILHLLGDGISELVLDGRGLHAQCRFESVEADGPLITSVLSELAGIADLLPEFASDRVARKSHYYFEWIAGAVAAGIFLYLVNARVVTPARDTPVRLWAAGIGIVLATGLTWLAAKTLRGTPVSLRRVSSIGICSFILCPVGSYWLISHVNHFHDPSPATGQLTTVAAAWTTQSKSSTYYHIEIAPWRAGDEAVQVYVSESFSKFAVAGGPIEVFTHPGRLGFEWIERFRVPPKKASRREPGGAGAG